MRTFLRFIVTCGNDGDVRIWESLDDDDPKFITVGEKAYSLALKVAPLLLPVFASVLNLWCNVYWRLTELVIGWFMFSLYSERQAGDSELQQHRADSHVSRWRSRRHPDPVHHQCHTCHLQQQWVESRSGFQVQTQTQMTLARKRETGDLFRKTGIVEDHEFIWKSDKPHHSYDFCYYLSTLFGFCQFACAAVSVLSGLTTLGRGRMGSFVWVSVVTSLVLRDKLYNQVSSSSHADT